MCVPTHDLSYLDGAKEYFAKTDWNAVSSNLEKLPYYAYMLQKHTPKANRKPAKAQELFTFATVDGWENTLNPNTLERIKELIDTYDSCLRRIRASAHLPKAQSKKNGSFGASVYKMML